MRWEEVLIWNFYLWSSVIYGDILIICGKKLVSNWEQWHAFVEQLTSFHFSSHGYWRASGCYLCGCQGVSWQAGAQQDHKIWECFLVARYQPTSNSVGQNQVWTQLMSPFLVSFKIKSLVKILLYSVIRLVIEFLPRSQLICFCFQIGPMERSQKRQMQSWKRL